MFKPLKLNNLQQKLYVGSDFHFLHDREFLWGKRGFKNRDDHLEHILSRINTLLGVNDTLVALGDMFLNAEISDVRSILARIKCQNIYYIWGNHERSLQRLYEEEVKRQMGINRQVYPFTYNNLTFLGTEVEIVMRKQKVVVSHFANRIWNRMHYGQWFLCGHSHASDKGTLHDYKEGMILDCSVESAQRYSGDVLFSFEDIERIMKHKKINILDHHVRP